MFDCYKERCGSNHRLQQRDPASGRTWTLRQVTGLLLVRAPRAGRSDTLSMTGLRGRAQSVGAGLGAGTPRRPGREAGILI